MPSINNFFQKTISRCINLKGIGLHSGRYVEVRMLPANEDHGIVFVRNDFQNNNIIKANIFNSVDSSLCTRIENSSGLGVNTIEHFMAAFNGLSIDNLLIEVNGPEMPIFDGSSKVIAENLIKSGIIEQNKPKSVLKIKKEVSVFLEDGSYAKFTPSDRLEISIEIDFNDFAIGKQKLDYRNSKNSFLRELVDSRTFCCFEDIENMQNSGLAIGGSLDNAIVVDNGNILNPEGLRSKNEFVKHKALDCLGNLYLIGMQLNGKLSSYKPGHKLSQKLIKQLFNQQDCYNITNFKLFKKNNLFDAEIVNAAS